MKCEKLGDHVLLSGDDTKEYRFILKDMLGGAWVPRLGAWFIPGKTCAQVESKIGHQIEEFSNPYRNPKLFKTWKSPQLDFFYFINGPHLLLQGKAYSVRQTLTKEFQGIWCKSLHMWFIPTVDAYVLNARLCIIMKGFDPRRKAEEEKKLPQKAPAVLQDPLSGLDADDEDSLSSAFSQMVVRRNKMHRR